MSKDGGGEAGRAACCDWLRQCLRGRPYRATYLQAQANASRLGISVKAPASGWSGTDCVRRMLLHCGIRLLPRGMPFRSRIALPDVVLLAMRWHLQPGKPFWHWGGYAITVRPLCSAPGMP